VNVYAGKIEMNVYTGKIEIRVLGGQRMGQQVGAVA
jgi:hypothetical protein